MFYSGILLILVSRCFKVGGKRAQTRTPVFEGSPTLITAFMSTVVKTAGFMHSCACLPLVLRHCPILSRKFTIGHNYYYPF